MCVLVLDLLIYVYVENVMKGASLVIPLEVELLAFKSELFFNFQEQVDGF